jgi:hypothetical protein
LIKAEVEKIAKIYKKYLLNTAQLCWADENGFAEGEMF